MVDFLSAIWLGLKNGWWEAYALIIFIIGYTLLQYLIFN